MLGEVLGNMPNIVVNTIPIHHVLVRIFLSHFLSHSLSVAQKMLNIQVVKESDGAASVIRTRDLTLTKGALYRWSYGSVAIKTPELHEIARRLQAGFVRVSATA